MGFTLRFMLGLALVLATCSVLECASSRRHIRQVSPLEESPDVPISEDRISNLNATSKEEAAASGNSNNVTANHNTTAEAERQSSETVDNNQKVHSNEPLVEKKPKTENNIQKQAINNKTNVHKPSNVSSNDNSKVDLKVVPSEEVAEASVEKPNLKESNAATETVDKNTLKKTPQIVEDKRKATLEKVPEIKPIPLVSRAEGARSLDIDINKYVSPEFHNKNNVYSFSVSPDTEKYTNLHNELPKSTTSRLQTQESSKVIFGSEPTTPLDEDFAKKFQHIEEGVRQKLEYIDHQFPDADHDFKKSEDDETVHIDKLLEEPKTNDTTVELNYVKFKNITDDLTRDKNKIHKEVDVESGQNIDFVSSYNRTHAYEEPPKDYKNKIPHEEDLKPDIPEHSEVKTVHKTDSKEMESEVNDKIPEINVKESTSLTKPPSLNKTENHKSLLSNNIETEVPNPVENNMKIEWDFPYSSTSSTTPSSTTQSIQSTTLASGQTEEASFVPYGRENMITVSKRGSTKYVDTLKTVTTTESMVDKKTHLPTTVKSGIDSINKQALAKKENKTMEQAVLENQVYPVQIPPPHKDSKEEKVINDTTEKSVTTENSASLPLKLYTISHTPTSATARTNKLWNFHLSVQTEATTVTDSTTSDAEDITTEAENTKPDRAILLTTVLPEETTKDVVTETSTSSNESEITSTSKSLATASQPEISSTTLPPYTSTVQTEATPTTLVHTTTMEDFTEQSAVVTSTETVSPEEIFTENSDAQEPSENVTTTPSYEDATSTLKNVGYSEADERFSNGRDLKTNSSETNFNSSTSFSDYQTVHDHSNNLDLGSTPTTEKLSNLSTQYHGMQINRTKSSSETTSDYRENIIVKQPENDSVNHPDESSHELVGKHNLTNIPETDGDTEEEFEPDPDIEDNHHPTLGPRIVKPHLGEGTTETTPFIIPLNVSLMDTDNSDTTTIGDNNLGLEADGKGEGNGGQIAAIVISCIGAACLIILAGLLFVMRKRHKRFNYGQRCTPVSLDAYSVDNVSVYNSMRRKGAMRASKRSYGNPAFEDPTCTTHSLNFPTLAKFANNTEGIAVEFEEIPQVTAQMNELPEGCETKNRYANVIPLPETRVFLNAIDGYPNSDYINANYITGPKSTRGYYIACQAPMQNTVDDFWRMVWEQQSKVILMLTHLFENGTEKCVDYLPPSEVLDCHRLFGDFQVTLKKREVKEKYVISSLQLKNMVSNSWREITHLWYLGWPEKGVPSEANSLIAYLIEARSYIKAAIPAENGKPKSPNDPPTSGSPNSEQSPVIVHCSPGTGRTGTVIACDIAIREFELARQVDIPKTVYRIRRDRASSVQTKEQYAFIYKVISLYATKLTGGVLDSL